MDKIYFVIGKKFNPIDLWSPNYEKLVRRLREKDDQDKFLNLSNSEVESRISILDDSHYATFSANPNSFSDIGSISLGKAEFGYDGTVSDIVDWDRALFDDFDEAVAYIKRKNPDAIVQENGTIWADVKSGNWEYKVHHIDIKKKKNKSV